MTEKGYRSSSICGDTCGKGGSDLIYGRLLLRRGSSHAVYTESTRARFSVSHDEDLRARITADGRRIGRGRRRRGPVYDATHRAPFMIARVCVGHLRLSTGWVSFVIWGRSTHCKAQPQTSCVAIGSIQSARVRQRAPPLPHAGGTPSDMSAGRAPRRIP